MLSCRRRWLPSMQLDMDIRAMGIREMGRMRTNFSLYTNIPSYFPTHALVEVSVGIVVWWESRTMYKTCTCLLYSSDRQ